MEFTSLAQHSQADALLRNASARWFVVPRIPPPLSCWRPGATVVGRDLSGEPHPRSPVLLDWSRPAGDVRHSRPCRILRHRTGDAHAGRRADHRPKNSAGVRDRRGTAGPGGPRPVVDLCVGRGRPDRCRTRRPDPGNWPTTSCAAPSVGSPPTKPVVILFDGGDLPLASFGPKLAARAKTTLKKVGVDFRRASA